MPREPKVLDAVRQVRPVRPRRNVPKCGTFRTFGASPFNKRRETLRRKLRPFRYASGTFGSSE